MSARPGVTRIAQADHDGIIAALSSKYTLGGRAGYVVRIYPAAFKGFSMRALNLYRHLADLMGKAGQPADEAVVPLKVLAKWGNCSTRQASTEIRQLVRTGPFPLLIQMTGRKGRSAGRYRWVLNPFTLAERQARDAEQARQHRRGLTEGRVEWNLANRPPIEVIAPEPMKPASPLDSSQDWLAPAHDHEAHFVPPTKRSSPLDSRSRF